MKPNASQIILMLFLLIIAFGLFAFIDPMCNNVDVILSGTALDISGNPTSCTVKIKGTYTNHLLNNDEDSFNAGYDGGIWIDENKTEITGIGFFDEHSDYSVTKTSKGSYIVDRDMQMFVACVNLDGKTQLIIAPSNSKDDALQLLQNLSKTDDSIYFNEVYVGFLPDAS